MLLAVFTDLLTRHQAPAARAAALWREVETAYSARGRHYHTLHHLTHLLAELEPYQAAVPDFDALLFALFYHDLVYNPLRSDNEARSAQRAVEVMCELAISAASVDRCERLILATRHASEPVAAPDFATALFTDADLAILGADPATYATYAANVRREFAVFPDLMYRPGRRRVLQHFLAQPHLYRTPDFRARYEAAARRNLAWELAQ